MRDQPQRIGYILLAMLLDVCCTIATLEGARMLRDALPYGMEIPIEVSTPFEVVMLTAAIWFGIFLLLSVYDPNRNRTLLGEIQSVVTASLLGLLVLAGALYFSYRNVSRLFILYFYALNLIVLLGWRLIARAVLRLSGNDPLRREHRVLLVGSGELGRQIAALMAEHGHHIIGFLDDDLTAKTDILGRPTDAPQIVQSQHIDDVIITLPYQSYDRLEPLILSLQKFPVQISVAPNYFNLVLYRATVEDFGGVPLINLRDPALTGYQRLVKRAFDLVVGSLLLLLSLPLLLLIAVVVRLDSPGSIIFKQQRVGENGRLFTMLKFRTMRQDAETEQPTINSYDAAGHVLPKRSDDPRVTRVGFFLRRTSLDELPQLVNVLRGEMSLVGPRPEMPWLVEKYAPWQHKRFAIPQGMTGWWQINGRADKPMHLHTEDDLYYIQNYSLLLDVIILWRTLFAVIRRRGAY